MMNEQAATMNKNTSSVSNNDKEEQQQQQRVKATTTSTTEEKVVKMDTATKSSIGKEEEANTQKEVISKTTSSSATSAAAAAAASFNSGKWTTEEFEYMIGLMEAFKAGQLPLQEGTTLRSFLSSMMGCKPKRIRYVERSNCLFVCNPNGCISHTIFFDSLFLALAKSLKALPTMEDSRTRKVVIPWVNKPP